MNKRNFCIGAALAVACSTLFVACAAAQKTGEWKALFDGKSTKGWRSYGKKTFPDHGWVVEDGCLHLKPNSNGGDIITEETFKDFELEWDWKIAPKANNGIKYLVTEDRPKAPGHEYQMIDETSPDGNTPLHSTASFYAVLPPQVKTPVHEPGKWNHSKLIIQGNHVEHWLNDVKVLTYELGSAEVKEGVAKSKFKDAPKFGEKLTGHIMLTDHHGETWYKNIRVRELPAK